MLSLHTNAASLFTKSNLNANQSGLSTSMTRLGTGLRINSAMDDAAGLQIATRLNAQSRGMSVAMRNTQNATSMLQTGEGALNEVSNIVLRMKDLATQAADGSSSAADKTAMQTEFTALSAEITNIMGNTKFGGQTLLTSGTLADKVTFQIGADGAEKYEFNAKTNMDEIAAKQGLLAAGNLTTGANAAIALADNMLKAVSDTRSDFGAGANRLQHVYNNLANVNNNTLMAKGRIMDTDYASESASMTSKQMLMQAGTSMLKQSGSMSQLAMSLLQ
ncbi:Lateral flagellin [Rhodobacteraceae bacterium CH30]|nr:Lateral flagellin [Rhodobacteraceae bacterium CH30]